MSARLLPLSSLPLLLAAACAQTAPPAPAPAAPAAAPPKVYVIGASVSGGFEDGPLTGASEPGDSVPLQTVLRAWLQPIDGEVEAFSPMAMQGMFMNPAVIGAREVKAARNAEPDLVVGVDFAFWFGYGRVEGGDERQFRLHKLDGGLQLLAGIDGELILGDFPDMTGAAARMLAPSWVPAPAVLQALNERLAAWAQQHQGKPGQSGPKVHLFPLAQLVRQMKTEGVALPLQAGELKTPPGALLQGDRLHATRLGMAFLGYCLQQFVQAEFAADSPLRRRQRTFDEFVAAVGAEGEVELLRAKAKADGQAAAAAGDGKQPAATGGRR